MSYYNYNNSLGYPPSNQPNTVSALQKMERLHIFRFILLDPAAMFKDVPLLAAFVAITQRTQPARNINEIYWWCRCQLP